MANFRTTISADTTGTALVTVNKPRILERYFATLNAYGTFGSGTLSYSLSTNGGTTKVPLKFNGSAYSATSADAVNIELGVANVNGFAPIIYAVLSGSTNPSITIDVEDNS